jgi:hypothetical protein
MLPLIKQLWIRISDDRSERATHVPVIVACANVDLVSLDLHSATSLVTYSLAVVKKLTVQRRESEDRRTRSVARQGLDAARSSRAISSSHREHSPYLGTLSTKEVRNITQHFVCTT